MPGYDGQFGLKSESTVGTAVTVDTFHEGLLAGAQISQETNPIWGRGIRNGRRGPHVVKQGAKPVNASVSFDLYTEPLATLLTHMMGDVATTGASDPYTHVATPDSLTGQALTLQLGLPAIDDTVHAITAAGCKVSEWSISVDANSTNPATLDLSFLGMTTTTATALASASYGSGVPLTWAEGSLSIASSEVATIRSASITGNNGLTERFRLGDASSKEILEATQRSYTGNLSADFEDLTAYNRFINGTAASLELVFTSGSHSLTIDANVWFTGETPALTDGILEQPLPFTCFSGTSDADMITLTLVNGESSAA